MSSCDWFEAKLTLLRLKDTLIGTAALPVSVNTDVNCQRQAREGICMRIFFPTSFSTHFKTLVKVFFPHRPRTWSLPSREINVRSKVRDPTWNSLISHRGNGTAVIWKVLLKSIWIRSASLDSLSWMRNLFLPKLMVGLKMTDFHRSRCFVQIDLMGITSD